MDFPPFVHGMSSTVITSYADGFTLLALARVQPLPRHRGETGQRIREETEPEKIFRMQILFRFLPLSFLHLSSSLIFGSFFLPSFHFLFKLLFLPAGSSLRIVGQLELSRIIRARYRVLREGKNRREKERELMNSDRLLFDLVGRARWYSSHCWTNRDLQVLTPRSGNSRVERKQVCSNGTIVRNMRNVALFGFLCACISIAIEKVVRSIYSKCNITWNGWQFTLFDWLRKGKFVRNVSQTDRSNLLVDRKSNTPLEEGRKETMRRSVKTRYFSDLANVASRREKAERRTVSKVPQGGSRRTCNG